jgi:hypothetical protein
MSKLESDMARFDRKLYGSGRVTKGTWSFMGFSNHKKGGSPAETVRKSIRRHVASGNRKDKDNVRIDRWQRKNEIKFRNI